MIDLAMLPRLSTCSPRSERPSPGGPPVAYSQSSPGAVHERWHGPAHGRL